MTITKKAFIKLWEEEKDNLNFNNNRHVYNLIDRYREHFDIWYDETKWYDLKTLLMFCLKDIHKWWNDKYYDRLYASSFLCEFASKYMDIWWNPDLFAIAHSSVYLPQHCNKQFDIWWPVKNNGDPLTYNFTKTLICSCNNHIEKWWPAILKLKYSDYDRIRLNYLLLEHCINSIDFWMSLKILNQLQDRNVTLLKRHISKDRLIEWILKNVDKEDQLIQLNKLR